jgi:serine protease Do
LKLGRLESSEDFKAETKATKPKIKKKDIEIETLKISVRDITADDISTRKLDKNLKGVVITYISNKSPVAGNLQVGDIILEVQKNKILSANQLNDIIENIYKKGKKTLLLAIINKNNQRRYLGVKTN